jgi:hypothetical protein
MKEKGTVAYLGLTCYSPPWRGKKKPPARGQRAEPPLVDVRAHTGNGRRPRGHSTVPRADARARRRGAPRRRHLLPPSRQGQPSDSPGDVAGCARGGEKEKPREEGEPTGLEPAAPCLTAAGSAAVGRGREKGIDKRRMGSSRIRSDRGSSHRHRRPPWLLRLFGRRSRREKRQRERNGNGRLGFRVRDRRRFCSADARGGPSDHDVWLRSLGPTFGPRGIGKSRPRPRLWPGRGACARA